MRSGAPFWHRTRRRFFRDGAVGRNHKTGSANAAARGQARDGETGDEAMMDRMETRLGDRIRRKASWTSSPGQVSELLGGGVIAGRCTSTAHGGRGRDSSFGSPLASYGALTGPLVRLPPMRTSGPSSLFFSSGEGDGLLAQPYGLASSGYRSRATAPRPARWPSE